MDKVIELEAARVQVRNTPFPASRTIRRFLLQEPKAINDVLIALIKEVNHYPDPRFAWFLPGLRRCKCGSIHLDHGVAEVIHSTFTGSSFSKSSLDEFVLSFETACTFSLEHIADTVVLGTETAMIQVWTRSDGLTAVIYREGVPSDDIFSIEPIRFEEGMLKCVISKGDLALAGPTVELFLLEIMLT